VRCGAVRCGAVRCGAVRCGAVLSGAVRRGEGAGLGGVGGGKGTPVYRGVRACELWPFCAVFIARRADVGRKNSTLNLMPRPN
jgi:hypothetical protein